MHDDAWSYGYLEGLKRMQDYVLVNPQSDLRSLKVKEMPPDLATLKRGASIGKDLIPSTKQSHQLNPDCLVSFIFASLYFSFSLFVPIHL